VGRPTLFSKRAVRSSMGIGLLLAALLGGSLGQLPAAPQTSSKELKLLRSQAEQWERLADWEHACQTYDLLLRLDRTQPALRDRLLHCLRRYYQASRQKDPSYRRDVLTLSYPEALHIYQQVVTCLRASSLQQRQLTWANILEKGLEEFRYALVEPVFLQYNLPGVRVLEVEAFLASLDATMHSRAREVISLEQTLNVVRDVAMEALGRLHLPPTTTVLEFTCGACYACDEYTTYLTPAQLRELCAALKGEGVGVGLRLAAQEGKLVIAQVLPHSPAEEEHLLAGWVVTAIDGRPVAGLTPEAAMTLLQGESGTVVELAVETPMGPLQPPPRLRRRPVFLPSVSAPEMKRPFIGYIHLSRFQDTTPQEVDAALQTLARLEARVLVLDLRGNSGGSFEAAIDTARRFLARGIITSTQYPDARHNTVYRATGPAAWTLPLVVLIDGDTASAAEVLAGALKDNKRALLVGQPTFGKGCLQQLFPLPLRSGSTAGGLRLTVAHFCSPSGQPYAGRGVVPQILLERSLFAASSPVDEQLEAALEQAQQLLIPPSF
jgi:carboxyl-terminal processing protease